MSDEVLKCIIGNGLYALIFSDDYDNVFNVLNSIIDFDEVSLSALIAPINDAMSFMDETIESNCYRILDYYREKKYESVEEKNRIFDICNELIKQLNGRNKDKNHIIKCRKLYIYDMLKEKNIKIKPATIKEINTNLDDYFRFAKEFVISDFRILLYNSVLVDELDYNEYLENFYTYNPFFLNCVLSLIDIYPELLSDQTFRMRIKLDLEVVKKYIETLDDKTKKLKQKQLSLCLDKLKKE